MEVIDENREILSTLFEISFEVTLFHFFFFLSFVLVMASSYWSSFCFQVHHGGAGTTAAGLRAAVILMAIF